MEPNLLLTWRMPDLTSMEAPALAAEESVRARPGIAQQTVVDRRLTLVLKAVPESQLAVEYRSNYVQQE